MAPRISQVTPVQVRKAVLALQCKNVSPTIIAVREYLNGGSTKILSEILREQKNLEKQALGLASQISAQYLFDVIKRELDQPMYRCHKESAAAALAGHFNEHNNALSMSLREYVEAGFSELLLLEEQAEAIIDELYTMADDEGNQSEIQKELWLRAISHSSRNADHKELTLLFVEDWLQSRDFEF